MGIQCSKRKEKPPQPQEQVQQSIRKSQSTSKEALNYCDSSNLANFMRTKPIKSFLADVINKQQIQLDSCEQLSQTIESKSEVILRCYNDFTEKALKIKLKVIEYYKGDYLNYKQLGNDTKANQEFVANETMQLLLETIIILNCLMDKNFNDEEELWWGGDYFYDRISKLGYSDPQEQPDEKIVQPILRYISALKNKILPFLPQMQQPKSIVNSTAIANVHLTQFYQEMKLDFARPVGEEQD